jgi:hypothetical protein
MIPTNIQYAFLISFKWCRHYSKGCVPFTGHYKTFTTQNTLQWRVLSPMHCRQWDHLLPPLHNCLFCRFTSSKLAQNSNISNLYSEGARFKSGSNYWLFWLRTLVVPLSTSRQMLHNVSNWTKTIPSTVFPNNYSPNCSTILNYICLGY